MTPTRSFGWTPKERPVPNSTITAQCVATTFVLLEPGAAGTAKGKAKPGAKPAAKS